MHSFLKYTYSSSLLFLISFNLYADVSPSKQREDSINNQIIEYLFDADIVKLSSSLENNFNLVMNRNDSSQYSVLLLHGRGLYPTEPNVMEPLRTSFIDQEISTFSLQLPVLEKGKSYYDYKNIFKYSDERISSAINFIQSHKLIIIAHSCGAHMLFSWINNNKIQNISGLILIGAGAVDVDQVMLDKLDYNIINIPILNIYGENDHGSVKNHSMLFGKEIKRKNDTSSKNIEISNSDHNYLDHGDSLVNIVNSWLKSL